MLRHAEILGWIVCGKQCIEKAMEFSHAYETDVADFHGLIWTVWTGVPEGTSVVRISKAELFAKDVVVGHDYAAGSKKNSQVPMILGSMVTTTYKDGKRCQRFSASFQMALELCNDHAGRSRRVDAISRVASSTTHAFDPLSNLNGFVSRHSREP